MIECDTVMGVIVFVCIMTPSAFDSLHTTPLISSSVDIRGITFGDR